jgi:RNA polymerase sigma-70 factor (ECF subfamily)
MQAFHEELLPHLTLLRGQARRFGDDADDLVQETLLRALEAERCYRLGSNARAWLVRILHNVAVSEHRRRARDFRLHARVAVEPRATPKVDDNAPRLALRSALATLGHKDRQVLELADVEGLRYREVARALDWPIGTVMSRLHRARRRLRDSLGRTASRRARSGSAATGSAPSATCTG